MTAWFITSIWIRYVAWIVGFYLLARLVHRLARPIAGREELGQEAVALLPNLLEPWQVISDSGIISHQTKLTLLTKARFGKAAHVRPRLLALI